MHPLVQRFIVWCRAAALVGELERERDAVAALEKTKNEETLCLRDRIAKQTKAVNAAKEAKAHVEQEVNDRGSCIRPTSSLCAVGPGDG